MEQTIPVSVGKVNKSEKEFLKKFGLSILGNAFEYLVGPVIKMNNVIFDPMEVAKTILWFREKISEKDKIITLENVCEMTELNKENIKKTANKIVKLRETRKKMLEKGIFEGVIESESDRFKFDGFNKNTYINILIKDSYPDIKRLIAGHFIKNSRKFDEEYISDERTI